VHTVAPERKLLKIGDVAARLNCSEDTVRRLIARGLPVLRLGHRGCSLRVDPGELESWLYSNGGFYPRRIAQPAERRVVVAATRPLAGPEDEAA
jgi:helix-turn-helix protein